ncbi:poly(A) RNA polymerase GLD2-like, partial [Oculina patagonica]
KEPQTPTFIDLDKYLPKGENKQPVNTPTFIDLDKYLPKGENSNHSPFNRRYPKPITSSALNQKSKNDTQSTDKKTKNTTSTTTSSTTSSKHGTLQVNVTREQRTISLSSGEALYSSSGEDTGRRPAKRRHHSTATPGYQDEIDAKRAKRNYTAPQAKKTSRLLEFNPFDVEPPVFTLDTLTKEIQEECLKSVQTMEILQKKLELKSFLETILSSVFPGCSLQLCGSSSNGFGGDSSDADFCCILNHLRQPNNRQQAMSVLRQMQRLLNNDPNNSFLSKSQVIPAKVPILKFKDMISGCECDININNVVGVRNTHLLRAYCGVDYRVQPLVMLIKRWAKQHGINDASHGTLSSYSLTLMVIHYLQGVCKPAVVPVLQRQYPAVFKYHGDVSSLLSQDPCKQIACNQSENRQSLGELFVGFFKYYAVDFRWNSDYISIAMGAAYPRHGGDWNLRKPVVIEEPFDGNNVAKAVHQHFDKIHMKFRLAWHTLKISPSLESLKVT